MTSSLRRLLAALALSVAIHGLPFVAEHWPAVPPAPLPTPLAATLRPPPVPAQPPLYLPEPLQPTTPVPSPAKPANRPASPPSPPARNWVEEVKRQFKKLDEAGEFYPREAIAQGMQGEATVLLVLDEDGSVAAARLEQSSGYRLLDEAALRAARSLRALPADAPRETLIPVRFRLR